MKLAVVVLVCGIASTSYAKKPKPSPDAAAIPIFVEMRGPGSGDISTALVEAGYRVVVDESTAAVRVRVSASGRRKQIPFTNLILTEVQLFAAFIGAADSQLLFQATETFTNASGSVNEKAVAKIVDRLTAEGRLDGYAQVLKQREQERLQREAAQRQAAETMRKAEEARKIEAAQQAREDDDALWASSDAATCRAATALEACSAVDAYLAKLPAGAHVDEAKAALADAKPKLAVLVDQKAWSDIDTAKCRHAVSSQDCDAVESYLASHPSSAHAEEAAALLKNPSLVAAQKREMVEEQHREQVDARKAQAEARKERAEAKKQERETKLEEGRQAREEANCQRNPRCRAQREREEQANQQQQQEQASCMNKLQAMGYNEIPRGSTCEGLLQQQQQQAAYGQRQHERARMINRQQAAHEEFVSGPQARRCVAKCLNTIGMAQEAGVLMAGGPICAKQCGLTLDETKQVAAVLNECVSTCSANRPVPACINECSSK